MFRIIPALTVLAGCGQVGLELTIPDSGSASLLNVTPEGEVRFEAASPTGRTKVEDVTFVSAGTLPVYVADVWLETNTSDVFILADDLPFPKNLEPGVEVAVSVRFLPLTAGTFRGTLIAEVGTDGTLVERELVGEGCEDEDHDGSC